MRIISVYEMISVICPIYNEEKYIENILNFFVNSEPKDKELILIDGGSTDDTIKKIEEWVKKHRNIYLLHNANKYVPFALNLAIQKSSGDPIIRLDAHTIYEPDYFEKILETFKDTGADIVGGPMRATGKTPFQRAVAYCTSTIFGIGDSKIHDENFSGYTDHVYLGAWRRNIFYEIGYFDEELKRNQDDEFHYRAKSFEKKIYLNSQIKSLYFPRSSVIKLIKQYFQYGLFKPLVLKKVKSEIKFRHLIPSAFVLYIITIFLLEGIILIFVPLVIYFILQIWFSFVNFLSTVEKLFAIIIYPALHLSYGAGFLVGLAKLVRFSK